MSKETEGKALIEWKMNEFEKIYEKYKDQPHMVGQAEFEHRELTKELNKRLRALYAKYPKELQTDK